MPDPREQPHDDRFAGLRDLDRRQRGRGRPERERGPEEAGRPGRTAHGGATGGPGSGGPAAADRLRDLRVPGRRPVGRRLLRAVNVIVAVCLVAGVSGFAYVEYRLGQVHRVRLPGLAAARSSGPFTVLIVGSDTRALGGANNGQFGTQAQTPGQRSDTIMLARVVPARQTLTLMSIPRDLWVPIRGIGHGKINAAFDTGPELLISTIEADLGIPVNHFIEVNFDSFRAISDAVGGVKFWFPTPARDPYSLLSVSRPGCVTLVGNQALAFVRSRHYQYYQGGQWIDQGLSDLARIQRQQIFVKKMLKKAESKFTDPFALNSIVAGVTRNLTVDNAFSASLMLGLAEDFRHADVAGIPTETLPVNNYYPLGQGGPEALSLAQPQASRMIHAFNTLGDGPSTVSAHTGAPSSGVAHRAAAPAEVVPSKVAVEVANGSGATGQAAAAAAAIGRLGYQATVTTSTPGYGFTANEVRYAPGTLAEAKVLATHLAGGATLVEAPSLVPTPYDVELVTGHRWAGLGTGTAHVVAASPSATRVPWVLPGPDPTEAQLASC